MNIDAERQEFERVHPVPEGIEWFAHQQSYDADNDTPLREADIYNALFEGWLSRERKRK